MVAGIMTCLLTALLHGILVYGADKRNRSALLIWIILQIIGLVAFSILALGFIFALRSVEDLGFLRNWKFYFIIILIFVGVISFPIWTVLVAIRVRNLLSGVLIRKPLEKREFWFAKYLYSLLKETKWFKITIFFIYRVSHIEV